VGQLRLVISSVSLHERKTSESQRDQQANPKRSHPEPLRTGGNPSARNHVLRMKLSGLGLLAAVG
jgi:hypothetical protein